LSHLLFIFNHSFSNSPPNQRESITDRANNKKWEEIPALMMIDNDGDLFVANSNNGKSSPLDLVMEDDAVNTAPLVPSPQRLAKLEMKMEQQKEMIHQQREMIQQQTDMIQQILAHVAPENKND
jgi:hypothetical protein